LYGLKVFTIVAAIWTAFLLIDVVSAFLAKKAMGTDTKFDDLLIPLISKSLKVFVVCVGAITCAQTFNMPIAGLLGGLGIGGAAIAFASKDAIANLFGSVTVLTDRPFEIGDWIKTEGIEGTVESVGFRSSRVRTFYNSLVTLPNSRLTTAIVDNMGRRTYRRITATLGVQYDTTPQQIDAFCEGIRELIRRHPYTRKDYYHVYLNGFSDSSLDIMLYCFVLCPDWSVELREKHRLFVDIMKLAEGLGVSFAFPTRTLHLYQEQHGSADVAADLSQPDQAGRRLAATVAGPLLSAEERPGGVEFRGPTPVEEEDGGNGPASEESGSEGE
jgi:MscS family membrane protein